MSNQPPPAQELIAYEDGKVRTAWLLFFQTIQQGDSGNKWSPVVQNLSATGTPTIAGNYYQNNGFTDFFIKVTPGTNTSSVAGTTFIELPFSVAYDTDCAATGGVGSNVGGAIEAATRRCYPPAWTNVAFPITITGRVKN